MSPKLMDPKKRLRLLRKAAADAYGNDRTWMRQPWRTRDLVRSARQTQELLMLDATAKQGTLDAAIREIEGLCLLVEELVRETEPL